MVRKALNLRPKARRRKYREIGKWERQSQSARKQLTALRAKLANIAALQPRYPRGGAMWQQVERRKAAALKKMMELQRRYGI